MTLKNYTIGFALSLLLTLGSFSLVEMHLNSGHRFPTHTMLAAGIISLAIIQLCVQLVFFLHLGRASKTRDLVMLSLAVVIIALFVGGSLWIMANLMHNTAIPFDGPLSPQTELDD